MISIRLLVLSCLILAADIFYAQQIELPTDYLSAEFHRGRREALKQNMPPNSVSVFFANPVRNRANDVDYVYHQDPNFYYLTGYKEPHAMLILFSELQEGENGETYDEIFYAQTRNPFAEMWTGRRLGPEGVKEKLGISNTYDHTDFEKSDIDFSKFDQVMFFDFKNDVRDDARNEADLYDLIAGFKEKAGIPADFYGRKYELYQEIRTASTNQYKQVAEKIFSRTYRDIRLKNDPILTAFVEAKSEKDRRKIAQQIADSNLDASTLDKLMGELREVKSPEEMSLLRMAVDISAVGQREVMKAMHPGMSENEIQGIHEFVFKKYGAEYEGYPSIVGAGYNGCILHYVDNNRPTVGTDLVLMDLGAEYHGYTADVTRTIPADGTFTEEQAIIYNIVLEAQNAGFGACKPGAPFRAPHQAAREVIDRRLVEIGLVKEGQRHRYFPHGTSHYLGLDVHDPGTGGPLQPGVVITVEPGIYIPHGSPCDEKWWGIAVRIEDDILITEDGYELLSGMAPRTVKEIEALMAEPSALEDFLLPDLGKKKEKASAGSKR